MKYELPELEVILLNEDEIVTASTGPCGSDITGWDWVTGQVGQC